VKSCPCICPNILRDVFQRLGIWTLHFDHVWCDTVGEAPRCAIVGWCRSPYSITRVYYNVSRVGGDVYFTPQRVASDPKKGLSLSLSRMNCSGFAAALWKFDAVMSPSRAAYHSGVRCSIPLEEHRLASLGGISSIRSSYRLDVIVSSTENLILRLRPWVDRR
jgi:hypothetical protein